MIIYFQIALAFLIYIFFLLLVREKYKKNPIEDLGVMWLTILVVYCVPLPLGWALSGFDSSQFSDRLYNFYPTIDDFSYVMGVFLCLEIGFASFYLVFLRTTLGKSLHSISYDFPPSILMASVILFTITWSISFYIQSIYIGNVSDYLDLYVLARNIPLWIGQSLKMINGVLGITKAILIVYALQNWSRFRYLILLYILVELALYDPSLDRSGLLLSLFLVFISYHMIVRTVSMRVAFIFGVAFLIAFSLMGDLRVTLAGGEVAAGNHISGIGESEGYWTNALHMHFEKQEGEAFFPAYVRFSEFYSFIPSQLLGFEELDVSNWYMMTYYPAAFATGQGLTFGVLAQTVAGNGMLEGIARGAAMGIFYALIMNMFLYYRNKWWALPVLAFVLVGLYSSVRVSSFTLIASLILIIIPSLLIVTGLAGLIGLVNKGVVARSSRLTTV